MGYPGGAGCISKVEVNIGWHELRMTTGDSPMGCLELPRASWKEHTRATPRDGAVGFTRIGGKHLTRGIYIYGTLKHSQPAFYAVLYGAGSRKVLPVEPTKHK